MELTFLGHQTWLISHENSNVLLDPVICDQFGHSPDINFRVYPPRKIDVQRMPAIDAVILSHEHLDHFHLPSINLLSRDIPFYVGNLLPSCVSKAIEKLGFTVYRVFPNEPFIVKGLEFRLFPSAQETIFWEKRVTQVYANVIDSTDLGIFVGVDALIADEFVKIVVDEIIPVPRAIVVANNSQMPPPGAVGAYSNLLPVPEFERNQPNFEGVRLLNDLLIEYLKDIPQVKDVVICGNGFVNLSEAFGPFLFSDNKKLATIANEISLDKRVFGPYPGECLKFLPNKVEVSTVDWVELDKDLMELLLEKQANFLRNPVPVPFTSVTKEFASEEDLQRALKLVESELTPMARAMMTSDVGLLALATNYYLEGPLGSRRILFRFLGSNEKQTWQYALDFNEAQFVPDDTPTEEVLTTFPFGVEIYLQDFAAVIEGRLQIWDLAGNALRSWFFGSAYKNVVVFLFEYFGEQVRPDLAWKVYERALAKIAANSY